MKGNMVMGIIKLPGLSIKLRFLNIYVSTLDSIGQFLIASKIV